MSHVTISRRSWTAHCQALRSETRAWETLAGNAQGSIGL